MGLSPLDRQTTQEFVILARNPSQPGEAKLPERNHTHFGKEFWQSVLGAAGETFSSADVLRATLLQALRMSTSDVPVTA